MNQYKVNRNGNSSTRKQNNFECASCRSSKKNRIYSCAARTAQQRVIRNFQREQIKAVKNYFDHYKTFKFHLRLSQLLRRVARNEMASSTNQEQHQQSAAAAASNSGQHNLTMQQQQQQQHELLKLIAQHFHNQFYQLGGVARNSISASNQLTTGSNQKLHHQNLNYHHHHHQQQQQHYQEESLNYTTGNTNNTSIHLAAPSIAESQLDLATAAAISNAQQSSNPLNLYSAMNHDLNLFSALGLNLTNNQLVLSLQQQSLIQAAAAARQYEMAKTEAVAAAASVAAAAAATTTNTSATSAEPQSRIRHQKNDITTSIKSLQEREDNHQDEGKARQLKFSIKTILGRGSPQPGAIRMQEQVQEAANNLQQQQHQTLSERLSNKCSAKQDSNKLIKSQTEIDEQLQQIPRGSDYDATESYSDSSSINNSTPNPQTSANILFNQTFSSDHHRATQLNSPSLMTNNLAHQTIKFHQQSGNQNNHAQHQTNHHHPLPFLAGSTAFPWTVAARGKPRRGMMRRAVFSDSQRVGLEKRFQVQKYISKPDRKKLAEKLGLRDSQVKIWFQNRRMKWRNSKERELLSAGGSREQTLPTRNNPNPDLSDVGETLKRLTTTSNGASNVSFNK